MRPRTLRQQADDTRIVGNLHLLTHGRKAAALIK
jgi:hypothetical protein